MKGFILFIVLFFNIPPLLIGQDENYEYYKYDLKRKIKFFQKYRESISHSIENQKNYDVKYYRLEIDIDTLSKTFQAKVGISAEVIHQPIDSIVFDFTNYNFANPSSNIIDSIKINSLKVNYHHYDSLLVVSLDRKYVVNEKIYLTVYYLGKQDSYYFMIFPHSGKSAIYTLSEPFGARFWWPCKDDPMDKADSVDLLITVPKNYIVASNGTLRSSLKKDNKQTFYWHEGYPIATYLVSIAAYPYNTFSNYYKYSSNDSMEIQYYVYPDSYARFTNIIDMTPNMLRVLSEMFGQYPFIKEKYGEAEISIPLGMENQTCTSLGVWGERIKVHELAHSWWGNMITCKNFHHIWLNEGFATYSEALYAEKVYGKELYFGNMLKYKYLGEGKVYRDSLYDDGYIFYVPLTYNKAAWVLHMLRHVVSDSTFFRILKSLCSDSKYQYNVMDTEDFQSLCESIYGKDLSWFFHQWIYEEKNPEYEFAWTKTTNDTRTMFNLRINQTQPNYIFKMPIDITLSNSNWDTTIVVMDSLGEQNFSFMLLKKVDSLFLDKNDWILCKKSDISISSRNSLSKAYTYNLYQNYPNPFNTGTKIAFSLEKYERVEIKLYDILGREVRNILNDYLPAGWHEINFEAKDLATGMYFYKLKTGGFTSTKKLLLLK